MLQARRAAKMGANPPESDDVALIALGSNLASKIGTPTQIISESILCFQSLGLRLQALSAFYRTPCFPSGSGPEYTNAAAVISTDVSTARLLEMLHKIESQFNRERLQRWGQRTLDLDLIARGDSVLPDRAIHDRWRNLAIPDQSHIAPDQLILPHPRLQDRSFVLVPLADIAANWIHPVLNQSVAQMLANLPEAERKEVKKL